MIPTNMADAAMAIKDGEFGFIEEIKIGELMLSAITGIDAAEEMAVTERSVQAGFEMTIAAILQPSIVTLDIVLANPEFSAEAAITAALTGSFSGFTESWRDKKAELLEMFHGKQIIDSQTHDSIYPKHIIQRIAPYYDVNEQWDSFFAQVTLQQVKLIYDIDSADASDLLDLASESAAGAI